MSNATNRHGPRFANDELSSGPTARLEGAHGPRPSTLGKTPMEPPTTQPLPVNAAASACTPARSRVFARSDTAHSGSAGSRIRNVPLLPPEARSRVPPSVTAFTFAAWLGSNAFPNGLHVPGGESRRTYTPAPSVAA